MEDPTLPGKWKGDGIEVWGAEEEGRERELEFSSKANLFLM